jgi:hypothetical protein
MDLAESLASTNAHMKDVTTLMQQDLDPKVRTLVVQPVVNLLIAGD